MNTMVALPILAATPTTAPAMPSIDRLENSNLVELGGQFDRAFAKYFRTDDLDHQPSDELIYAIAKAPGATSVDWRIKAKTVVLNFSQYWEWPFSDLDWDEKMVKLLIDSIFAAEGSSTVEQYLASLGCELKARPKFTARPHTDSELIDLGKQYEELLSAERPLERESHRLYEVADRRRYERMGIDPDDKEACNLAARDRWAEWVDFRGAAGKEVGYDNAYDTWHRASKKTARVGRKIMKQKAHTAEGLRIKARVIETHDEVCSAEPQDQLLAEIRSFAAAT
jgi:hypothetical protein